MPFVVWGTRGITRNMDTGSFYCPGCRQERVYKHKSVRRFFTVYFIPLIPMNKLGEYVECQVCSGTYNLDVLQIDMSEQRAFKATFEIAVKRVLALMVLADGVVEEDEVEMVRTIYNRITNRNVTSDEVRTEISTAQSEGRGVEEFLTDMAGTLNNNGKGMVVQAAYMVAGADGEYQQEELDLMNAIGDALLIHPKELKSMMDQMTPQVASGV
ncbi:MAG: TerB family tellurite resistance protein [Chloroflexota bacterium]